MFNYVESYKVLILRQIDFYLKGLINDDELIIILNNVLDFMFQEKDGNLFKELANFIDSYNLDKDEASRIPKAYPSESELRDTVRTFYQNAIKRESYLLDKLNIRLDE